VAVLNGDMTQDEAITQMKRITRVFVRRQANWFKEADRRIQWFEAGDAALFIQAEKIITDWLS
jgi:tRNA A37 N6-isopentenylltransferase MiaA